MGVGRAIPAAIGAGLLAPDDAEAGFAGRLASTADEFMLSVANKMEAAGMSPDDIWKKTGWFRGPGDNQWRFEFDDSMTNIVGSGPISRATTTPVSGLYPDIGENKLYIQPLRGKQIGQFDPRTGDITLNRGATRDQQRSTFTHELQHAIQNKEGFEFGSSPQTMLRRKLSAENAWEDLSGEMRVIEREMDAAKAAGDEAGYRQWKEAWDQAQQEKYQVWDDMNLDPYPAYRSAPGEVEARTVQERLDWSPRMRKEIPPWESYQKVKERGSATPMALAANAGILGAADQYFRNPPQRSRLAEAFLSGPTAAMMGYLGRGGAVERDTGPVGTLYGATPDLPAQGLYGLLAASQGGLGRGAQVAQQPIDQSAQQFGDWLWDRYQSPLLSTAGYTGANLFGF